MRHMIAKCKSNLFTMAIAAAVAGIFCSAACGLDLVKDGKPCATIVLAGDAGNYQKWAAQWLQEYVKKATEAELPIVSENEAEPAGTLISVGHTKMAGKAGIKTDDLQYDGCKLIVKGGNLYLIGRDEVPRYDKSPSPLKACAQGTLRAVTTFLEDLVGVRWFIPGPDGTLIPRSKDLSIPDSLNKAFVPAMAYATGRTTYPDRVASFANNLRMAMNVKLYGGHSWASHVPSGKWPGGKGKEYFRTNPEYYRVDETGKRNPGAENNCMLCTSNMDVRRLIVKEFQKLFDEGYDAVELGVSDGWRPCYCPECEKLRGGRHPTKFSREAPCEEVWDMNKWIIDELAKSHPNKYVMQIIYGPQRWPSKRFEALPDNVIAEVAGTSRQQDDAWRGKVKKTTFYQAYWWEEDCNGSVFAPPFSPQWIQQTMRDYRDRGVIGMYGGPRICWGLSGPTFYAYCRLTADPDLNMDRLLDEYYNGVYVEAAPAMSRFFKVLHDRTGLARELESKRFPNSYPVEDAFTALYPPAVVDQLDRLLKSAEKKARSERAQGWVKHTRDCFDGVKAIARMFAAKRAFELTPTRENLLQVKQEVETFEQWRARILAYVTDPDYTKRWFPAYEKFCGGLMSEGDHTKYSDYYYSRKRVQEDLAAIAAGEKSVRGTGIGSHLGHHELTAPITWGTERMVAGIGQRKHALRVVVRRRAHPLTADGVPDAGDWQNATPLSLGHYQDAHGRVKEGTGTIVRVVYDEENLYVHYECSEPLIEQLNLKPVGRDGNVYAHDEVELFLNPQCTNRKRMQFMASPIRDAWYDERKGYVEDVLDPRYGAPDVEWNAEWRYTFAIDKAGKQWTLDMTVPFKGIEIAPPTVGTVWLANFARCRRAEGGEDLTCWSPETFGSHPDLFGEMVFGDEKGEGGPQVTVAPPAKESTEKSDALNAVKNGGFEQLDDKGQAASWRLSSSGEADNQTFLGCCSIDTEKAHSGKSCFSVDFRDLDPAKMGKATQISLMQSIDPEKVKAIRGKEVILSMWLNYDYIAIDAAAPYSPGPMASTRMWAKDGPSKSVSIILNQATITTYGLDNPMALLGNWIKAEQRGVVPAETERMDISVQHVAVSARRKEPNITAVRVDDIRLEPVHGAGKP